MDRLYYKHPPIGQLTTLARLLKLTSAQLDRIARRADSMYREGPRFVKQDGTVRQTWDAMPQLKAIQGRIKNLILCKVEYPSYLNGGLRGRDYKKNAGMHKKGHLVITEDIERFFPSITADAVYDIWTGFFRFPDDVANCLTRLTTKNGKLPEGGRTSSHLANLAFWRVEGDFSKRLQRRGIRYSRLIDDITTSSKRRVPAKTKTEIVRGVVGMLQKHGFRVKRKKHSIASRGGSVRVNNLAVARKVSLPKAERARIRAAVHEVELLAKSGCAKEELQTSFNHASGRLSALKPLHSKLAEQLHKRLTVAMDSSKKFRGV